MEEKTYTGFVTYYSPEKHFGFIDGEAGENIFFHYDTAPFRKLPSKERKVIKSSFIRGDELLFKIRTTEKGLEAYDLQFIKNEKAEQLLKLLNENEMLPGYLKKINDEYFVKDKATYLFLPVSISTWETDIIDVYDQRINQFVYYLTPETTENLKKAKVKLSDRRFSSAYQRLKEHMDNEIKLAATITGNNSDGYFVTILDGEVPAFLFFRKGEVIPQLEKWQQVDVLVKSLYETGLKIQLIENK